MKIGDRIYVHGHVDEIRKDTVIVRNDGGYFGTVPSEIIVATEADDVVNVVRCKDCRHRDENCGMNEHKWCVIRNGTTAPEDYCSYGERREL